MSLARLVTRALLGRPSHNETLHRDALCTKICPYHPVGSIALARASVRRVIVVLSRSLRYRRVYVRGAVVRVRVRVRAR
eukprot:4948686-Pyramimonas_sp.AAC.1